MNIVQRIVAGIDRFQRRHRWAAFIYAVVKKYGDDQAGHQAAMLTYYGFLSLFPLLLVLTTLAGMIASHNAHTQQTLISSITNYFPVLGNQLSEHVHTLHKTGLALVIGLLFTLYGARGVADAFRNGTNHIWQVPRDERDGFPKSVAKDLSIIIVGGVGLVIASISSGVASAAGRGLLFYILSVIINLFVLYWVFIAMLNISLPGKHIPGKKLRSGAATAAIGLVILQELGGLLVSHELKNLSALYSNFAIPLGLLFWIYLQSQVLYYAVEIADIRARRLWPRSLSGQDLTDADKTAYAKQADKEKVVPPEDIKTTFNKGA